MTATPRAAVHVERPLPTAAIVGIFALIGLNLRTTFGAVPPLLDDIGDDLGLSGIAVSLLTAIPIVCLGALAPPAQWLARRIGHEQLTALALLLLTVAETLRLAGHVVGLLYLSTFLSGTAMGAVSTVMPGLIGHHVRRRPGFGAGVYSMAMATGSTIAAWASVPLAEALGGWNRSLASWAVPTAVCTLAWLLVFPRLLRGDQLKAASDVAAETDVHGLPWRSRTAWLITYYFALNTFLGFSILTWLAPAYLDRGWSAASASHLLSAFFAVQVVAMIVFPAITDRTRDRRPLLALSIGCSALGTLGLAAAPDLAWMSVVLYGLGLGGGFALGLVLLVDVTSSRGEAARLSAMVFLLSYCLAALGPVMVGALRDLTGSFTLAFWILSIIAFAHLAVVPALRPGRLLEPA
ncbi:MAG: MFS transporter [Candidatus Nanopelagicales bacterium]